MRTLSKTIFSIVFLVMALFMEGCHYDKADLVYPKSDGNCDTADMKYSDIVPILSENCYKCHKDGEPDFIGIPLDKHDDVAYWVNLGVLIPAINHDSEYLPMPQPEGAPKLPDCYISKIEAWVNAGMPEK